MLGRIIDVGSRHSRYCGWLTGLDHKTTIAGVTRVQSLLPRIQVLVPSPGMRQQSVKQAEHYRSGLYLGDHSGHALIDDSNG